MLHLQGSLSYARAHWVARSLIAWDVNVEDTICYLYASKSAELFLTDDGFEGYKLSLVKKVLRFTFAMYCHLLLTR